MDRSMMMPPATRPPGPPNFADLTPEEQQALLAEGWQVGDDGSLSPPGMGGQKAYDYDSGGYGAVLDGPPATAPPAGPTPSFGSMGLDQAAPDTLNARIEFGADMMTDMMERGNPMGEAAPEPFEAPEVTPPLQTQGSATAPASMGGSPGGEDEKKGYGGRIGRRMASRQSKPTGRPANSRRRR